MVIRSGPAKAGATIAAYVLVFMVSFLGSVLVGEAFGFALAAVAQLIAVLALVRHFRGDNESNASRPLWRMTAYPAFGFVLASLWTLQGLGLLIAPTGNVGWVQYGAAAIILGMAALFANSSFKLVSSRRQSVA
ncbi:hypothetical protein NMP99_13180 [Glutamicibacter mishrai]|uniref:hypothetical protein n=1 Tax=Glutamicibacter mishrai TaxID=1775880 RepID=UPI0020CDA11D|nr:hypothetical protein [Glutamicibacter mishrai]UTT38955.1 hypothetical protein NMP99_13180 [Glutamicibacter mishrai]